MTRLVATRFGSPRLTSALVLAAALAFPGLALAKSVTAKFKVEGWSCGGCAEKTAAALKKVAGVSDVKTDVKAKEATVTFDDAKTSRPALEKAIKEAGFGCDMGKQT